FGLLRDNYDFFVDGRAGLYAYMHPLLRNPGPRRLTNALLSRLAWVNAGGGLAEDPDQVVADYFSRRYGAQAAAWREVYGLISRSSQNAQQLYAHNSLTFCLFQQHFWAVPFYTPNEVAALLPLYRQGGTQDLPARWAGRGQQTERATFPGLDASLALQDRAALAYASAIREAPPEVRARMEQDVAWFEALRSRTRLMAASCDLFLARVNGDDPAGPITRCQAEIAILEGSTLLNDTISPTQQSAFLRLHRQMLTPQESGRKPP
ncbi:MAG: hypothetical protein AB1758_31295, partial [Candidatus Eremiobacterota bacterium]